MTVRTRRDIGLDARLYLPPSPGPHPLVILLHGFTGWKEEAHVTTLASSLAERGIAGLAFDAPGSGASEGTWAEDYRLSHYLESVTDVIDAATASAAVDPSALGLWGHSMGGFVAIAEGTIHPERYRALCASQPSGGRANVSPAHHRQWEETGWASFAHEHFPNLELPYDFFVDSERFEVSTFADQLRVPCLLVAGTRDSDVSANSVRATYDLIPGPKRYAEFDVDHQYKESVASLTAINEVTIGFFIEHLRPDRPPHTPSS
jgi:pimeloyl-ACP methyl ester carboxylesterase